MKTVFIVFILFTLMTPFSTSAETVSTHIRKAWGPGMLDIVPDNSGVIEHTTDGRGSPDFLLTPLRCKDFRNKILYFEIKITRLMNFSGVEIRLGDEGFKNYYAFSIPYFSDPEFNIIQEEHWHSYSFGLSNTRVIGDPNEHFSQVGMYIQDNGQGPLHVAIRNIRFQSAPETGFVSLTFDDGYLDHNRAAEIMARYNLAGTAYVMPRQIGKPGYMNLQQIEELRTKYNWGISSHHEIPYTDFTASALTREIRYTLNFLADNGFPSTAPHLAYPLGKQDREVVLPVVRQHFETARVAGGGVETLPPADPHLLRTINVLDTSSPEALVALATNAVENGQWAILMFHYLVDEPASATEYRESDFKTFIQLLAKANVPVLPVHEVYNRVQSALPYR